MNDRVLELAAAGSMRASAMHGELMLAVLRTPGELHTPYWSDTKVGHRHRDFMLGMGKL